MDDIGGCMQSTGRKSKVLAVELCFKFQLEKKFFLGGGGGHLITNT